MKICIICVNKKDYAPKRLYQESIKMGHDAYLMRWNEIFLEIEASRIFIGDKKKSIDDFNIIIPRSPNFSTGKGNKKRLGRFGTVLNLIIEYAKDRNIAVLNDNFFCRYQSRDKLAQQYFLSVNKIPGILTWHFTNLKNVVHRKKIKFPVIIKKARGSLGIGVYKAENEKVLKEILEENAKRGESMIVQKYFPIEHDYRVLVIDGKAIGIMKRVSGKNEWKTNISLGGKAIAANRFKGSELLISLVEKTAKKMKLDYAGVDILESEGKFYIIEVNSLPQFKGFEKAFPKVNVAAKIINSMVKKYNKIAKKV